MNRVLLIGRTTRDPEIRYASGNESMCIARFTLAVDRRRTNADGQREADFISCAAFGKIAELMEKCVKKGMRIAVGGHIQTGSYTNKDGTRVYTTEVIIDDLEFLEYKSAAADGAAQTGRSGAQSAGSRAQAQYAQGSGPDGFMDIPDDVSDDALPFA
jgi:single-strand DNA-binding protein